uniref:alpha/beta hydrolase family protein n=1 Tax=Gordonia sp. B7-2 TaxID=3420932 RepID=UPI003D92A361
MQLPHATHTAYDTGFYSDEGRDYSVRCLLGTSNAGGADVGEVLATISGLKGGGQAWFDAWLRLGRRVRHEADASAAGGHRVSAAWAYLRAANYLSMAVDAVDELPTAEQRLPVFREHRAAWESFIDHGPFDAHRLTIPYEDTTLPGWFLAPLHPDGGRPTLVMINGSDGAVSGQWSAAARGALERGYNVVMFDWPGQQSMLFEHQIPFRPDWEAVLTPVTDVVLQQPGVDSDRLALYGISQAGYWVPRSLAFEHRYRAAIADPGVVDVATSWMDKLPSPLRTELAAGKRDSFDRDMGIGMKLSSATKREFDWRARPYGATGYFETYVAVQEYRLTDELAAQIRTPMLVTAPEHEQFWPGQSARLVGMVGGGAELMEFTAADGASWHCQPMARAMTDQRMFDWLDVKLA